jgi:hypothetical protein
MVPEGFIEVIEYLNFITTVAEAPSASKTSFSARENRTIRRIPIPTDRAPARNPPG